MSRLRSLPRRNLYATLAVLGALAITGPIANAALNGDGNKPPAKSLANAVSDVLSAPAPAGVSARIKFTNNLLPAGSLPEGTSSPLVAGAEGRLWVTRDGRFRLELKSRAGDAQIVSDGKKLTVYDAVSNTVYELRLSGEGLKDHRGGGDPLSQMGAGVSGALGDFMRTFSITDPPARGSTADRPSYTVRIAPKDDGGLLGAAELAWDAERGVPLRAAVYAAGKDDPVVELAVQDISFAPVPDADVMATPPSNAKVVQIGDARTTAEHGRNHDSVSPARSVAEVQRRLDFDLSAPAELAGLPRRQVRTLRLDNRDGALLVYGDGLGSIAVLQFRSQPGSNLLGGRPGPRDPKLPEVNIDGATGVELATALGTGVAFDRAGVTHVVLGLVPPQSAETAARGLR